MDKIHFKIIGLSLFTLQLSATTFGQVPVDYNPQSQRIKIQDQRGSLVLKIDCNNKCVIDNVEIFGNDVVSKQYGVFSSIKTDGKLYASNEGIQSPTAIIDKDRITINGIVFGEKHNQISEKWIFRPDTDFIDWTIERTYTGNTTLEDTGYPEWSFNNMDTWTGALQGTGGVAWCRFFDRDNASLGSHTGKVTFWNQVNRSCLSIVPSEQAGQHVAVRFSRQPDNRFTLNYTVSEDEVRTKHFLARFIIDRQDIWDAFDARGTTRITYRLRAIKYDDCFSRGDFKAFSSESVEAVLNTIARVGVIDEKLMGSNNWHLDMGFVCLHEQWIAQMGLAIDDEDYLANYRKTLDFFRDNALSPDGNVKDRWAYRIWDSKPGTFENGFYECQWGDLLDANTDYVINVSELFQIIGDTVWVRTHKNQCEKALAYLLARDSDHNGLIEAYTDSHAEKKGSDWIDVIWASWENAFINAKLFYALTQWANVEEIAGDKSRSGYYRDLAEKCKYRFNQPVTNGGFWSREHNWYVYWRDRDGSVHGDNLVTPVNFMAIAYGICDDRERKETILSTIENLMQKEKLFMWPISFFPYQPDEGYKVNYPFPNYENGDIFLAWGEAGIRAYQDYDPSIPVKYIKNVLNQYEKDGLACQRYKRVSQEGAGNDILANNSLPVVGLYRDIYGIQPQYNRLYLDPHLTKELNGTLIKYRLRNQDYIIGLSVNDYTVSSDSFIINSSENFGLSIVNNTILYFNGKSTVPSMVIKKEMQSLMLIRILNWNDEKRIYSWKTLPEKESTGTDYDILINEAGKRFSIFMNGKIYEQEIGDAGGKLHFSVKSEKNTGNIYEIRQQN
jgi:hypothetical protein